MRRLIYLGCLVVGLLSALTMRAQEFRALVVEASGAGFLNAAQVTQLVSDCRTYNFNAVIVQMRRNGEAYYMPQAPNGDVRATNIATDFDALAEIIAQCHTGTPRIEVHTWVTAQSAWNSATPPSQSNHVFNAHPEYLVKNYVGNKGYSLDPANPEAARWVFNIAKDIVSRYDIDGFVWQHVGYPAGPSWGYNDVTIARYNAEMGTTGKPSSDDAQFAGWLRRQVAEFLRWTRAEMLLIKPDLVISAVVDGDHARSKRSDLEDWEAWANEGIIDVVLPMVGITDGSELNEDELITEEVDKAFQHRGNAAMHPWLTVFPGSVEFTVKGLNYIANQYSSGYVLNTYQTLSEPHGFTYLRDHYQTEPLELPDRGPATIGVVRGTITRADTGDPLPSVTITLSRAENNQQMTSSQGTYAFFDVSPGDYTVEANMLGLGITNRTVTVVNGANVQIDFVMPVGDVYPPDISDIHAIPSDVFSIIRWKTNEDTDSQVEYGTNSAYGQALTNNAPAQNHELILTNLTPGMVYHYRVKARDSQGLETVSSNYTFTTRALGDVAEIIIDNPEARVVGDWLLGTSAAGKYGSNYHYKTEKGNGADYVEYRPLILKSGGYLVYAWYSQNANRSVGVPYIVSHEDGSTTVRLNQQVNGGKWVEVGYFQFAVGTNGYVRISDDFASPGNAVIADAVRFVYLPPQEPPSITAEPESRSVYVGESVTFSVTATGSEPLFYQWLRNNAFLTGKTNATLTLPSVNLLSAGDYQVIVTNRVGAVVSATATLTVLVPASVEVEQASVLPDGRFYLKLNGETAGEYIIEVSSDLIHWEELTTLSGGEDTEFYDTPPAETTQRYYRVKWQP